MRFDGLQNRLFTLGQTPEVTDAIADDPQTIFVEPAGSVLPIASDEWRGIAFIQELNGCLDLQLAELKVLGDPRKIKCRGFEICRHGAVDYLVPSAKRERNSWGERARI